MDSLVGLADSAVYERLNYNTYLRWFMMVFNILLTIFGNYIVGKYVIDLLQKEVMFTCNAAASHPRAHQLHPESQGQVS